MSRTVEHPRAAIEGHRIEQAEAEAAKHAQEARKQRDQYLSAQPSIDVTHAAVYGGPTMTLAGAQALLEEHGGRVLLGDGGALRFTTPKRFDGNNILDRAIRRQVTQAIAVLDSARPTVVHLLKSKRPLPDSQAGAGGGVAG